MYNKSVIAAISSFKQTVIFRIKQGIAIVTRIATSAKWSTVSRNYITSAPLLLSSSTERTTGNKICFQVDDGETQRTPQMNSQQFPGADALRVPSPTQWRI